MCVDTKDNLFLVRDSAERDEFKAKHTLILCVNLLVLMEVFRTFIDVEDVKIPPAVNVIFCGKD